MNFYLDQLGQYPPDETEAQSRHIGVWLASPSFRISKYRSRNSPLTIYFGVKITIYDIRTHNKTDKYGNLHALELIHGYFGIENL